MGTSSLAGFKNGIVASLEMRVPLNFSEKSHRREPAFVKMECIPQVGELLVSGNNRTWQVVKLVYTPDAAEQAVILELAASARNYHQQECNRAQQGPHKYQAILLLIQIAALASDSSDQLRQPQLAPGGCLI